jgi:hypothetical protein
LKILKFHKLYFYLGQNIKKNVFLPVDIIKSPFLSLNYKRFALKNSLIKYSFIFGILLFVFACSTKKNTFLARNNHALSSKFNILYNGGIALDKGITELKTKYNDNFWEQLPIERMQVVKDKILPGQEAKNANFERAETKAIKAIQRHSMNIDGSEKNPQMDEAHLMLGKSRYYDQRFVPALEAFNYVLYKYPESDKIYEAKIWREKTNMRLDNDALAIINLNKLLKEIKVKNQIYADANATLAQAFLNLQQKDSAMAKLQLARDFTKSNEEKARYYFILGQLFENANQKDSAFVAYQSVIDMKRKASRQYIIQAHARQASQFDYEKGDTIAFLEKYNELLIDRENKEFLDILNHQMALFYDKNKNFAKAKTFYSESLKKRSSDQYLVASNYRNMADIFFNDAKYAVAGKYYDSTLVQLNERTREFRFIKKKRENLDDVIKYEAIANANDSILNVLKLSAPEKVTFYEAYISKLKKAEAAKKIILEEQAKISGTISASVENPVFTEEQMARLDKSAQKKQDIGLNATETLSPNKNTSANPSKPGNFYFYNPATVAYGKIEFKKQWGNRTLKNNWRFSKNDTKGASQTEEETEETEVSEKPKTEDEKYSAIFYISKLPTDQKAIDQLAKDRNFANYQLGVIYKEKFKEYKLAANKLEYLLSSNPEERLVLPSMYNLFKIYEILNKDKATAMKERIINQYPTSRYAQILSKAETDAVAITSPEAAYNALYKKYQLGDFKSVLTETTTAIDQYTGEEIVSKLEFLKANVLGKLKGLDEYKKTLNFIALNYPNSEEGKTSEAMLAKEVPQMEALQFYQIAPKTWKLLYKAQDSTEVNTKFLTDKIKKFLKERSIDRLTYSNDIYTIDKNFLVIHGIISEEYAKGIATILKEFKDYKIADQSYPISNENYKIVQIKKNFDAYLTTPYSAPKPIEATPIPALRGAPEVKKEISKDNQFQKNQPPSLNSDDEQGVFPKEIEEEIRKKTQTLNPNEKPRK